MKLVLTCEHATNSIPEKYQELFIEADAVLNSHRGYDPGAYDLFLYLKKLSNFNFHQKTGRLLVEVNRSKNHPSLFSEFTKNLPSEEKKDIIERYYFPYRNSVEQKIDELIEKGEKVLHFSVHSFTPNLNGNTRNADIGILYDPARKEEKDFSLQLKQYLLKEYSGLNIRFNYPYLGKADGFTTYLRKRFPQNYLGIELEVNQKFSDDNKMQAELKTAIFNALKLTLAI